MTVSESPHPKFIQSIFAGLEHWDNRTYQLDDNKIRGLDSERANLFRIVQYGLAESQTLGKTASVVLQTFPLIERHGYWQEWIPVLEKAIAKYDNEQSQQKFKLLNQLGQLHRFESQWEQGFHAHKTAMELAHRQENDQLIAECDFHLSELFLRQRRYVEAEKHALSAFTTFTNIQATGKWLAVTLTTLGELARYQGDLELADNRLVQALTHWREVGTPVRVARALNDLALVRLDAGMLQKAQKAFLDAAEILEPTTYELDKTMVQINLGALAFEQEDWQTAEAMFRKADSLYLRQSRHLAYRALVANNLGNTLKELRKYKEAVSFLQEAIRLWIKVGDALELANSKGTLAEIAEIEGRLGESCSLFKEALALVQNQKDDAKAKELQVTFLKSIEQVCKDEAA